jgi:hypothetical protein
LTHLLLQQAKPGGQQVLPKLQTWAGEQQVPLMHIWPEVQHFPLQTWAALQQVPLMHLWPEGQHVLPQQVCDFSQQWFVQHWSSPSQTAEPQHL